MQKYISLLRGINVSGKNILKMDLLKQIAIELEFAQVQTYIQSGNLVFQSKEKDTTLLSQKIQQAISQKLDFTIPVFTFSLEIFKTRLSQNPFTQKEELEQLYLTFFQPILEPPTLTGIQAKKAPEEQWYYIDSTLYLVASLGYGKTKISNTFLESQFKVNATTRNYKTCLTLIELAEKL